MVAAHGPAADLDAVFAALSDATRRALLRRLARGAARVTDLAEPFDMSLPAVSKHLRVLEGAGLVQRQREGREHWFELVARPMKDAAAWIGAYRAFWEGQLDALERHLSRQQREEQTWPQPQLRVPKKRRSTSAAPSAPRGKRSSAPGRSPKS